MTAPPIRTARPLDDVSRRDRMRILATKVLASRNAPGAAGTKYHNEAKAIVRPHLRDAIRAVRRARDALRRGNVDRCDAELARAKDSIQDARTDFLLLVKKDLGETQARRRRDKPSDDPYDTDRNERIRVHHARLKAAGATDATAQTAREFGLSDRQVRNIVNPPGSNPVPSD